MAILLNDITTIRSIEDDVSKATGAFDTLMVSARAQINDAVNKQEITQSDAGRIFGEILISVMSTSVNFVMGKDKAEAEAGKIKRSII